MRLARSFNVRRFMRRRHDSMHSSAHRSAAEGCWRAHSVKTCLICDGNYSDVRCRLLVDFSPAFSDSVSFWRFVVFSVSGVSVIIRHSVGSHTFMLLRQRNLTCDIPSISPSRTSPVFPQVSANLSCHLRALCASIAVWRSSIEHTSVVTSVRKDNGSHACIGYSIVSKLTSAVPSSWSSRQRCPCLPHSCSISGLHCSTGVLSIASRTRSTVPTFTSRASAFSDSDSDNSGVSSLFLYRSRIPRLARARADARARDGRGDA